MSPLSEDGFGELEDLRELLYQEYTSVFEHFFGPSPRRRPYRRWRAHLPIEARVLEEEDLGPVLYENE